MTMTTSRDFSDSDAVSDRILYEDNHIIIVNKMPGEIVQADKTGDRTLADDIKDFIKVRDNKPGNVFLGIPHRLDRPTSGIVIFAKTGKALERLNAMFKGAEIDKRYWAVTDNNLPDQSGRIVSYIRRDSVKNKSFAYNHSVPGSVEARLEYTLLSSSDRYFLYEIHLLTGRHHQIRAQLASFAVHIRGDLKYGFPRSNDDGGICLHSRYCSFVHPVSGKKVEVTAPVPDNKYWHIFSL